MQGELKLTEAQRNDLNDAVGVIFNYIVSTEEDKQKTLAAVRSRFKKRLYIEVRAEGLYTGSEPISTYEWVDDEIKQLNDQLRKASDTGDLDLMSQIRTQINRYRVIEGILLGHASDHTIVLVKRRKGLDSSGDAGLAANDAKVPQAGGPRRNDDSQGSGPSKGYFSGIKRNHVFLAIGVLAVGCLALRRLFAQSDEK